jgi:hypothetical protein
VELSPNPLTTYLFSFLLGLKCENQKSLLMVSATEEGVINDSTESNAKTGFLSQRS